MSGLVWQAERCEWPRSVLGVISRVMLPAWGPREKLPGSGELCCPGQAAPETGSLLRAGTGPARREGATAAECELASACPRGSARLGTQARLVASWGWQMG